MENEEWRDIQGYEGYYQVSNLGRVRSLWFGKVRILKQGINQKGYKRVYFNKDKKKKVYFVHRLVAEAFIHNPNNYPCVNHIDENPSNNNVDNLEWCTQQYNVNYGTGIKRMVEKITKPVLQFTKDGEFVNEYPSIIEAYRQTCITYSCISICCRCKAKSAGGFIWKFKEKSECN